MGRSPAKIAPTIWPKERNGYPSADNQQRLERNSVSRVFDLETPTKLHVDLDTVTRASRGSDAATTTTFQYFTAADDDNPNKPNYPNQAKRDEMYNKFLAAWKGKTIKGGNNMLQDIKKYISDNRDMIYTVAFVALLDQLLFDGAFRERLKALVEGLLVKVEGKQTPTTIEGTQTTTAQGR